jgi:hypothetical protein
MNHKSTEKIIVRIEARDIRRLIGTLEEGAACDISPASPKPPSGIEVMERAVTDKKRYPSIEDPGAVADNKSSLRIWKALSTAMGS